MEEFHDLIAVDDWLQQAHIVLGFQVGQFLAHHTEVLKEEFLTHFVLRRDVSLTECHQVVDVLTCIIQQTADGRVRHLIIGDGDGTHMEIHQFLDVFHLHIHGQHQPTEDLRHHLRTNEVVIMEGPADGGIPAFRLGLADVVHQRSPPQPQVI